MSDSGISLIDAIGRSGFFSQAGSDPALARTAVIESGTERLQVRKSAWEKALSWSMIFEEIFFDLLEAFAF
jgi:hypothetical protein